MNIACLCPTYLRPDCVRNVTACFKAQDHPIEKRRLFILDDGGQFDDSFFDNIHVKSQVEKFDSLPQKFNEIASWAMKEWSELDAFAIWEDDDVYLPDHLSTHCEVLKDFDVSMPSRVYSNYGLPKGTTQIELAEGRFHGSWAFTKELFLKVGGWPVTKELMFDQWFGSSLKTEGRRGDPAFLSISYVYRWGNGIYHGSQFGNVDFNKKVEELNLSKQHQGPLTPIMDLETKILFEKWKSFREYRLFSEHN